MKMRRYGVAAVWRRAPPRYILGVVRIEAKFRNPICRAALTRSRHDACRCLLTSSRDPWTTNERPRADASSRRARSSIADGMRVLDCTIRDISDKGARLLIANTVGLPDTFQLFEKSSRHALSGLHRLAADQRHRREVRRPARRASTTSPTSAIARLKFSLTPAGLRPHQQMRVLGRARRARRPSP